MSDSSNDSADARAHVLRDTPRGDRFDLPVDATYRERPPRGSWEAGYRLSLAALKMVNGRPEVFAQRDRRMCIVEFKM